MWESDCMEQDGFQSSSVDFLFADELRLEPQPIAKERSRNEFLHETLAHEPLVRFRRLLEQPRRQPRLSVRGASGDQRGPSLWRTDADRERSTDERGCEANPVGDVPRAQV